MTIDELCDVEIDFEWVEGPYFQAEWGDFEIELKLGDWPEEDLWWIYVNNQFIASTDALPPKWRILKHDPKVLEAVEREKKLTIGKAIRFLLFATVVYLVFHKLLTGYWF